MNHKKSYQNIESFKRDTCVLSLTSDKNIDRTIKEE